MNNNNIFLKTILACFICCVMGVSLQAKVIYVDDDAVGANNGVSWVDAYIELSDALTASVSGDVVYVAAGTYKPKVAGAAFPLKEGVDVYGGFNSQTAPDMDSRDWKKNISLLNGNGSASNIIFTGNFVQKRTVLDGFTLTHTSTANGSAAYMRTGMNLVNCHITGCKTKNGAVNLDGRHLSLGEEFMPSVTNCIFDNNEATGVGGGVCVTYLGIVRNCEIKNNKAPTGGGWASTLAGIMENTVISGNTATNYGGGISVAYNPGKFEAERKTRRITNCQIFGNYATNGGGVVCDRDVIIENCDIYSNTTSALGAGVWMNTTSTSTSVYGPIVLKGCKIHNNTTTAGAGGGIYVK